ncbi:RNA polymerase subunit sigma [Paenibacillus sp. PK3_47]|uniref:DUF4179 domain-containing protein n=1 Tax=Paenibacillus sp. PK3_47 TaxID=2072642 RepID=UPI00201DE0DC|nr:DUF4179 domain-containing protein [Paenibacillus sp. PK3_47]UQZ32958.1 RNA polymerase subunit sigma [Paenibacillus sp. PK3_47]
MSKLENTLKRQLNDEGSVPYPDFNKMWDQVEGAAEGFPGKMSKADVRGGNRTRNWRRMTVAASLSALLAAAPVYAAIQYDWGNLLREKDGIQAALDQNLGQQLEQSVTKDGVTLTLHTAIVDENRTVILYSMDVGERDDKEIWKVSGMSLADEQGNTVEADQYYQQWDEEQQRYNGYFETDWTPGKSEAKVTLAAAAVQSFSQAEQELSLNSNSTEPQTFQLGVEGMKSIEVKPFDQNGDKKLFASAVTFSNPDAKEWVYPQLTAYRGSTHVEPLPEQVFGTPGDNGEYTLKQYFKASEIPDGQTSYKLQYTKLERNISGGWSFDLQLSKKLMESGTIKTALNAPLEAGDTMHSFEQMVVTPTQIRVTLKAKEKYKQLPYYKYNLEVGGTVLEGYLYLSPDDDPYLLTLKFERPAGLVIDAQTDITFVGKYKVTNHEDDTTPLLLKNISAEKQTVIRETGGYDVKWTYYMQGKDLYVETESDDHHFGGINQTYIGLGNERILGRPVTVNFAGDGNNKAIDVYKDFKGTEASIYMFNYNTDEPDKETRVQLRP